MASGQQIAEANFQRFIVWSKSKTDDDFRNMVSRGKLSRTEITAECGFARSALTQNPRIVKALSTLEGELRKRGVLPPPVPDGEEPAPATPFARSSDTARLARDAERMSRLEQENASLKAENAELKRVLGRYTVLQEALAETGRLPR
jgi:hypothetical protein